MILSVYGGILGKGAAWKWYAGSCGGPVIGTGSSIGVKLSSNTIYYVRAEGYCNTTNCVSVAINIVSNCLDRSTANYISTRTTQKAGYATLPVIASTEDISNEYLYLDALGRTSQHLLLEASPSKKDILNINNYDRFGRAGLTYLPASVNNNFGMLLQTPYLQVSRGASIASK